MLAPATDCGRAPWPVAEAGVLPDILWTAADAVSDGVYRNAVSHRVDRSSAGGRV